MIFAESFIKRVLDNMRQLLPLMRKKLKWSQTETSLRCGISSATISKFEEGHLKDMRLTTFLKLCILFGISPNEMLCWYNSLPQPEPEERLAPYFLTNNFAPMIASPRNHSQETLWSDQELK